PRGAPGARHPTGVHGRRGGGGSESEGPSPSYPRRGLYAGRVHPARVERFRCGPPVARRALSWLVSGAREIERGRLRLAGGGVGDVDARAAPSPRVAGQRGGARGVRLGGGGELQAARGGGVRLRVLQVGR